MKRYFEFVGKRTVVSLEIADGSPASTATSEDFEKQYNMPMREITLQEYNRLAKLYSGPAQAPFALNEHVISEHYLCGGGVHELEEYELYENCTVELLKCKRCGAISGSWWPGQKNDLPKIKNDLHM